MSVLDCTGYQRGDYQTVSVLDYKGYQRGDNQTVSVSDYKGYQRGDNHILISRVCLVELRPHGSSGVCYSSCCSRARL